MSLRRVCLAPPASGDSQAALTEREGLSLDEHYADDDASLLVPLGKTNGRFVLSYSCLVLI